MEVLFVKKIAAFALVALGTLVLTGCSSAEKQAEQAQKFVHNETSLAAAQHNAVVNCEAAKCDAAWALTKRYIEQHSDTPVTRADAVAIDTDVPSGGGKASFSATRDAKGSSATLTLFAQCRGMYGQDSAKGSDYDKCADKILKAQNGYAAFLRTHSSGQ
jgi:outer membrane murein-binding lipoprotein Lpp